MKTRIIFIRFAIFVRFIFISMHGREAKRNQEQLPRNVPCLCLCTNTQTPCLQKQSICYVLSLYDGVSVFVCVCDYVCESVIYPGPCAGQDLREHHNLCRQLAKQSRFRRVLHAQDQTFYDSYAGKFKSVSMVVFYFTTLNLNIVLILLDNFILQLLQVLELESEIQKQMA